MENQITNNIIMIRPHQFGYNQETAVNNSFQSNESEMDSTEIAEKAIKEFDGFVSELRNKGIHVDVFDDLQDPYTPDAVFPNNWFSTHNNGMVISYPMYAPIRRLERRPDIIASIGQHFQIKKDYTFEHYEEEDLFLEGTGSLILDRQHKIVYAAISPRTDVTILNKWCILMNYSKVHFTALDDNNKEIYHTNVMMALGEGFAIICLDSIKDDDERNQVIKSLEATKMEIIDITYDQMNSFAGNMLQVQSDTGEKYLVMSSTAKASLNEDQIEKILTHTKILVGHIPTIEKFGGGSVRCMMAENFLQKKKA